MKIENLQEGQTVKNYKELCKLLEVEERKGGRNKQYHHEDFERHFEYHKEGHKYIIDVVYLEPLYKVNKSEVYTNLIQQLILNKLANEHVKGNKIITMSGVSLFESLYMVNSNYKIGRYNQTEISEKLDIDISFVNDFYMSTSSKLRGSLVRSLDSLVNKGIIIYNTVDMASYKIDDVHYTVRELTEDETSYYNYLIGEYITFSGKTLNQIRFSNMKNAYDEYIICGMSEYMHKDITMIYKAYKIYFNKYVCDELERINEYININHTDIGIILNQEISNRYKESYIDRHEKYINDWVSLEGSDIVIMSDYKLDKMQFKASSEYSINGIKLIDHTINRVRKKDAEAIEVDEIYTDINNSELNESDNKDIFNEMFGY